MNLTKKDGRHYYSVQLECGHSNEFCDPAPEVGSPIHCGYHGEWYTVLRTEKILRYPRKKAGK